VRNTFHLVKSSWTPISATQLDSVAAQVLAEFGTLYRAMIRSNAVFDGVLASQLRSTGSTDAIAESFASSGLAGTASTPTQLGPTEACVVLSMHTGLASRRYRGRLFLPPREAGNDIAGENWNAGSSTLTVASAFATEFAKGYVGGTGLSGAEISGALIAIFSRAAEAAGATPTAAAVTGATVQNRIHWLRSRARGTT